MHLLIHLNCILNPMLKRDREMQWMIKKKKSLTMWTIRRGQINAIKLQQKYKKIIAWHEWCKIIIIIKQTSVESRI